MLHTLAFFAVAGLAALAALGMVFFKNMVHSLLSFIACLLSVAGVFLTLQADYVAAVQVIVYAGAVSILIALAIFLIRKDPTDMSSSNRFAYSTFFGVITALMFAGAIFVSILYADYVGWPMIGQTADITQTAYGDFTIGYLGEYIIAFELVAILLLVALVAAITISKGGRLNG